MIESGGFQAPRTHLNLKVVRFIIVNWNTNGDIEIFGAFRLKEVGIINSQLLKMARGEKPAELVLKNARIIDVFNEEIDHTDLAIADGIIIGTGDYEGQKEIDLSGKVLAPGLIDGHLHLESAMVKVEELARQIIPLGTTTIVADPHEIANVAGLTGIKYLLQEGLAQPWNFNLMLPSCVPATKFETTGACLEAESLEELLDEEGIFGLGEVMDFPGVINGSEVIWKKLDLCQDKFIDGHAPGVSDRELNAYLLGGIRADHECTTPAEAHEKVKNGMYVMIREGSVTRDLKQLLPAVNDSNNSRYLFATDDRHPGDLTEEGHINFMIKKAVENGLKPLRAIKLATINAAKALGLKNIGAIAPGYKADLVVFNDLKSLNIEKVFKDGKLVAENGELLMDSTSDSERENTFKISNNETSKYLNQEQIDQSIMNSVNIGEVSREDFVLPSGRKFRVMQLIEEQIITKQTTVEFNSESVTTDDLINKDLVKLAVVERHKASGNVGLGLLKGLGLKKGAIATSIGHDSHNIIVAGLNEKDMLKAVEEINKIQGGIVVTHNGEVMDKLVLPIAGLMSDKPLNEVADKLKVLREITEDMGVTNQEPFMTLSFMALPVIPRLKVTDRGLFSAEEFQIVPLKID